MTGCDIVQVVGTGPLDAAAHLKLLGESLSVIGARLQEHKVTCHLYVYDSLYFLLSFLVIEFQYFLKSCDDLNF